MTISKYNFQICKKKSKQGDQPSFMACMSIKYMYYIYVESLSLQNFLYTIYIRKKAFGYCSTHKDYVP